MESRYCQQDKGIFFFPVHNVNALTPCSLQAFGIRCTWVYFWWFNFFPSNHYFVMDSIKKAAS